MVDRRFEQHRLAQLLHNDELNVVILGPEFGKKMERPSAAIWAIPSALRSRNGAPAPRGQVEGVGCAALGVLL